MPSKKQVSEAALDAPYAGLEALGRQAPRQMLSTMWLIRAFEEKAEALYGLGKVHGTMHLSLGQEGSAVGASWAMRRKHDYLLNHHRGHGHLLAWGADVNRVMAEFMGKEAGYCRGRGGSMHIADVDSNNLGANGIVAGGLPISVGVGLSIQLRGTDQVCLVLFGDGAANEGAFHESLNMASIWRLPIVFYCENNQYAMSMSTQRAFNIEHISQRGAAYGIPGTTIDGNDTLAVLEAVKAAAERARSGEGPTLIESVTYRWKGHSKSDRQLYRTRDEVRDWQDKDPIPRFAKLLAEANLVAGAENDELEQQAQAAIEAAVAFAESSPEPDPATVLEGLYA